MSFNFNPQPRLFPPSLSTAAMFSPSVPRINNPAPGGFNFLKQNYWEGAVRMNGGESLIGDSIGGDFSKFVCSFWAANLMPNAAFYPDPITRAPFIATFSATGPFKFFQPGNSPTVSFGNFIIEILWNGGPVLTVLNASNTAILATCDGPSDIMGWYDPFTENPILPLGVWHHYIVSYDASQPKAQWVVDRGSVFQNVFGSARGAFSNPSNLDWRLAAPDAVLIDWAYFYLGTSDIFFDLTTPGNLDYFISTSKTPVNLGAAGRNVTPLTCLIMHTGNATNLFGAPEIKEWQGYFNYPFTAVVSFEGKNYFSIFIGDNINNRPDISPNFWDIFVGKPEFQFPYNAATGRLWGGSVEDAPTQPPKGA